MSHRRKVLAAGLLLLICSAAERAPATTGKVEAVGYGGSSTGGWICGPVGRAKYAGGAVNARFSKREPTARQIGAGTGEVGVALEQEEVTVVACDEDPCTVGESLGDDVHFGTHAEGGHQWKNTAIEGGIMVWSGTTDDGEREALALPEASIRMGVLHKANAVLGFGSSSATTLRRPGGYVGAELKPGSSVEIDAYLGLVRSGPGSFDDTHARGDLVIRVPIADDVKLRAGGSVGDSPVDLSWEASGGVVAEF